MSNTSQIIETLKKENKVLTQEKNILTGSLNDIVEKLRVCNSRPRNTNVNTDIPGMSSFISDQISKMSSHDVMINEEVNVGEFLNDDEDNIVFVIDGKFSTIINKQFINLEDPTSLFYECIEANSAFFQNNNITGPKLFLLKKIGGMQGGLVWLEDLEKIKKDSTKNAFVLEKVKRIETLVSMDVIDNQNLVSGTHCQPGLNDTVYKVSFGIHIGDPIVPVIPTVREEQVEREDGRAIFQVFTGRRPPATQDEINQQRIERNRRAQELREERIAAQAAQEEQEAQEVPATREERLERIRVENEERVQRERELVAERAAAARAEAARETAARSIQEVPATREERLERIRVENEERVQRERELVTERAAAARAGRADRAARAARAERAERAAQEVSTQDEINQRRIVRGMRERRVPAIR